MRLIVMSFHTTDARLCVQEAALGHVCLPQHPFFLYVVETAVSHPCRDTFRQRCGCIRCIVFRQKKTVDINDIVLSRATINGGCFFQIGIACFLICQKSVNIP